MHEKLAVPATERNHNQLLLLPPPLLLISLLVLILLALLLVTVNVTLSTTLLLQLLLLLPLLLLVPLLPPVVTPGRSYAFTATACTQTGGQRTDSNYSVPSPKSSLTCVRLRTCWCRKRLSLWSQSLLSEAATRMAEGLVGLWWEFYVRSYLTPLPIHPSLPLGSGSSSKNEDEVSKGEGRGPSSHSR